MSKQAVSTLWQMDPRPRSRTNHVFQNLTTVLFALFQLSIAQLGFLQPSLIFLPVRSPPPSPDDVTWPARRNASYIYLPGIDWFLLAYFNSKTPTIMGKSHFCRRTIQSHYRFGCRVVGAISFQLQVGQKRLMSFFGATAFRVRVALCDPFPLQCCASG